MTVFESMTDELRRRGYVMWANPDGKLVVAATAEAPVVYELRKLPKPR